MGGNQPSNWRFDQERCRISLTKMTIIDQLSFNHVEKEGFRLFCAELQPKFQVMGRHTLTKDCLKMYLIERIKLKEYFKDFDTRVCLTTDMWTSLQNLGYMALTAHFIDRKWVLHKKIINFRVVPYPHKGEAIAKAIEGCLLEWGLEKITTITLDNAKNNDTCVADLKRRLNKRNGLLLGGEFFHIRCFAHVINLVVRDGIGEVKNTIKRLRRSVKYVRSGPARLQLFKKCVADEMMQPKKSVCLDVKTRWNSTYLMIDAALQFERVFDRLYEVDPNYTIEFNVKGDGLLDEDDWKKLKSLHTFLKAFFELTKRVSGSHYITSNTYFDELTQVKDLIEHIVSDDSLFRSMAVKMDAKFDKYCNFEFLNPILIIAIVLDPRYKLRYVKFWYSSYLEKCRLLDVERTSKMDELVSKLSDLMSRLYSYYKAGGSSNVENVFSTPRDKGSDYNIGEKSIKKPTTKDLFRGVLKRKEFSDVSNDLDRYLNDMIVENYDSSFDVVGWWKVNVTTYRALAFMARDVLAIPVTSVASESAFSTAGRVLDQFRSNLTPTIVESLLCTQDWHRNPMLPISVDDTIKELESIEEVVNADMQALSLG